MTTKIGTTGETGQTSSLNRSDRSGEFVQNAKYTSPLRRSRRDDRNAYMEHPIWTLDEIDMALGSSTLQADRSDRFGEADRPVWTVQSGLGVGF